MPAPPRHQDQAGSAALVRPPVMAHGGHGSLEGPVCPVAVDVVVLERVDAAVRAAVDALHAHAVVRDLTVPDNDDGVRSVREQTMASRSVCLDECVVERDQLRVRTASARRLRPAVSRERAPRGDLADGGPTAVVLDEAVAYVPPGEATGARRRD